MKALIIGSQARYEKFYPATAFADAVEKAYVPLDLPCQSYPSSALDADFIAADAIAPVPSQLIERMPNLKVIHSEGVAYDAIDCAAAAQRGIYVCNNKGVNADAVAEQVLLLVLGLLRGVVAGDAAVRAGEQIQRKERMMIEGITEVGDCTVGLVGFGDIARSLARLVAPWGCRVLYHATSRKPSEVEAEFGVEWAEIPQLLRECNVVSIHVPVTAETRGMVDEAFLRSMRADAYLINTARGEVVDNAALCRALEEGWIAGAGLDTVAPEPVTLDNPLLALSGQAQAKVLFSPHIGGVTTSTFKRAHANIWAAFEAVAQGRRPCNVVS